MTPKQLAIEYRSRGRKVPSYVKEFMANGGFDTSLLSSSDFDDLDEFGYFSNINPDGLNEFNEGGLHEENPNGGIQVGHNARVEEGESSIRMPQGNFVFSDRIDTLGNVLQPLPKNTFAQGGNTGCGGPGEPPCPPTEKEKSVDTETSTTKSLNKDERISAYEKERKFVEDWFMDPITMNKYVDRRIQDKKSTPDLIGKLMVDEDEIRKNTYWDVTRGLSKLKKASLTEEPAKRNIKGEYLKSNNRVTVFKPMFDKMHEGTSAHEFSHATGLDKELSRYAQKDVKYLQIEDDDLPNERDFKQYLNRGEIFPRIMGIRYKMGLKPGDKVSTEDIKKFKESNKGIELFKWYSDEDIRDLLNKSVDLMKKNKIIKNETRYT